MFDPRRIFERGCRYAFHVAAKLRLTAWISRHVVIPDGVGAAEPGPLDTSRVPPVEGLYALLDQPHVHFFTLAKSARVGGTLFCFAYMIYRLITSPGPMLWIDPTRATMRQLWRRELEAYLLACRLLKKQAITDKEHWNPSQAFFRSGAFLKMAGGGSAAELGGFNAEVAFINESDKGGHYNKGEAPKRELAIVRTKQFRRTRKVIENSTPTDKFGPTWRAFLKGSQHYCYLPCPHCSDPDAAVGFVPPEEPEAGRSGESYEPGLRGWQRLSFHREDKDVPFDEDLRPLPPGQMRPERTGCFVFGHCRRTERRETAPGKWEDVLVGWDYERIESETRYECQHCGQQIAHGGTRGIAWMLLRYRWVAHNAKADREHVSAHLWAAYSPFERWGDNAKKFVLAQGDAGALHDVYNSDFGLPYNPAHTEVAEEDIQKLVKASPHYLLGSFPHEPECLTATFDVQRSANNPYWYTIWAWGILWDLPGWPTFAALVDYGTAMSKEHIEELCALRPNGPGRWNRYRWTSPNDPKQVREYQVLAALIDSGDQAQHDAAIYDFCLEHSALFTPCKGGGIHQTRGDIVHLNKVYGDRLDLLWFLDHYWKQRVYHHAIKARRYHRFLPANAGQDLTDQLTNERTGKNSSGQTVWTGPDGKSKADNNHLGDCWKMNEVLSGTIEEQLDLRRMERMAEMEAAGLPLPWLPSGRKDSEVN